MRNQFTLAVCACALLTGCGFRMLLRLETRTIDAQLRFVLGGGGNSFVFMHPQGAFVSDPKFGSMAHDFRAQLEKTLPVEVRRLLVTHSHFDHAAGLSLYPDVGAILVHPKTKARLMAEGHQGPWVEVTRELQLTLGGEQIRVMHPGRGHTDGDLVALFVKRRLLVSGDLLTDTFEPFADRTAGGSLLELRRTLEALLSLDFDTVLPGHGDPVPRAVLEHVVAYLTALEAEVEALRRQGVPANEVARHLKLEQFEPLPPIPTRTTRAQNAEQLFHELEARDAASGATP